MQGASRARRAAAHEHRTWLCLAVHAPCGCTLRLHGAAQAPGHAPDPRQPKPPTQVGDEAPEAVPADEGGHVLDGLVDAPPLLDHDQAGRALGAADVACRRGRGGAGGGGGSWRPQGAWLPWGVKLLASASALCAGCACAWTLVPGRLGPKAIFSMMRAMWGWAGQGATCERAAGGRG